MVTLNKENYSGRDRAKIIENEPLFCPSNIKEG